MGDTWQVKEEGDKKCGKQFSCFRFSQKLLNKSTRYNNFNSELNTPFKWDIIV